MAETLLVGLITGLTGLVVGHRLRIGGDSASRRQQFRAKIRSIAALFEGHRNTGLYDAYKKTAPEIRDACASIYDDISFWKRRALKSGYACYLNLRAEEINPSERAGFFDNSMTSVARGKEFDKARQRLCCVLNEIIESAK